jgi:hypothetical protein
MDNWAAPIGSSQHPKSTTLLALVQALARQGRSERAIETEVLDLVEGGRAVLIGTFRDTPLRPATSGRAARWED